MPLNRLAKRYYWQDEQWMKDNRVLLAQVPVRASVVAQNNLVAHLAHRREIYLLWPRQEKDEWRLFWPGQPEYLVVDLHEGQAITHLLVNSEKELAEAVVNMEKEGKIELMEKVGEARLYQIRYN